MQEESHFVETDWTRSVSASC